MSNCSLSYSLLDVLLSSQTHHVEVYTHHVSFQSLRGTLKRVEPKCAGHTVEPIIQFPWSHLLGKFAQPPCFAISSCGRMIFIL